jgi:cell division protein FtsB
MFRDIYKPLIFLQIILVIYLGFLIYKEKKENYVFKRDYRNYLNKIKKLEEENKILEKRIKYLSNPENLKKELKDKFNLVEPGEKVIILPENF